MMPLQPITSSPDPDNIEKLKPEKLSKGLLSNPAG